MFRLVLTPDKQHPIVIQSAGRLIARNNLLTEFTIFLSHLADTVTMESGKWVSHKSGKLPCRLVVQTP